MEIKTPRKRQAWLRHIYWKRYGYAATCLRDAAWDAFQHYMITQYEWLYWKENSNSYK